MVPDRIVLSKSGFLRTVEAGRKGHRDTCAHGVSAPELVPKDLVSEPCLTPGEAVTLGRLLRKCEDLAGGPVEIEWAMDESGFRLLQSRPLHVRAGDRAGRNLAAASGPERPSRPASAGAPGAPWW